MHHSSDSIEMGGRKHAFNGRISRNAKETVIGEAMGMTLVAASASETGLRHCPRMPYIHIRPICKPRNQVEP
jgi:hypothetical protein